MDRSEPTFERILPDSLTACILSFTPRQYGFLSICLDFSIRVWYGTNSEPVYILKGHMDTVIDARFSPDGSHIVSASRDGTLRFWHGENFQKVEVLNRHSGTGTHAIYSPDGVHIVSASFRTYQISVWYGQEFHLQSLCGETNRPNRFEQSPDISKTTYANPDDTINVRYGKGRNQIHILRGHTMKVRKVIFSPDGSQIVSASDDNTLRVWQGDCFQQVYVLNEDTDPLRSVRFSRSTMYDDDSLNSVIAKWAFRQP